MPSIINASSSGSGGIVQTADASGVLQLQNNGVVGLTMTSGSVDLPVGGAILTLNRGQYSQQLKIYTNAASSGNAYYEYTNPTVNAQYYTHYFRGTNNVPTTVEYANINQYGIALGNTASTDGTGITFPATQNASSNANTLDDYEEGTWTPSIGGTATYTNQLGHYTKIGNFVKLRFHLEVNSLGTGSTVAITGIPFNPSNNGPTIIGGNVCYAANLGTAVLALGVYVQATGFIYFYTRNSSSTGATTQQPAIIAGGTNVYCEVSYQV